MTTAITFDEFMLPWEATRREDRRFREILRRLSLVFLFLAVVFPFLPLPEIVRDDPEIVPPSMAKVIIEHKLPAPPPPEPQEVAVEKPVDKASAPAPRKKASRPRREVAKMGVGAFSRQLQSLRASTDIAKLHARNTNIKTGAASRTSRSVLGRETATKTSGGVNADVMNGHGSGTQLAGRSGVAVSSPLGEGGGGGGGGQGSGISGSAGGGRHNSAVASGRDMESIRRTFEKHKGAIYAIYNRALRSDPSIRGKYVFHIVIEPSGKISRIELVSSELGQDVLEKKLLARIRVIDFGPEDVVATPVNYKFDFLPS